jgi:predicted nucleic acid-binding protein
MNIFVDTSAILAVLHVNDRRHAAAKSAWEKMLLQGDQLYINNYVLIETFALLQSRFGLEAVRLFQSDILPVMETVWVDEATHHPAVSALLAANRRSLSLVDCASFETMRQLGLSHAFTLDGHFKEQGFEVIPLIETT